jgi:hypothetical protein
MEDGEEQTLVNDKPQRLLAVNELDHDLLGLKRGLGAAAPSDQRLVGFEKTAHQRLAFAKQASRSVARRNADVIF